MRLEKLLRISSSLNLYRTKYINQLFEKHTREIVKTKVMSLTETSFTDYLS